MFSEDVFDQLLYSYGFEKPKNNEVYKAVLDNVQDEVYKAVKHALLQTDKASETELTDEVADKIQAQHRLFPKTPH